MLGTSHGTDEVAVRLSVPSPRFPASTVWVAPFDPGTTATVNAVCVSASLGAACNAAAPSRRNSPYLAKEKFFRTTWYAPSIDVDFVAVISDQSLTKKDEPARQGWTLTPTPARVQIAGHSRKLRTPRVSPFEAGSVLPHAMGQVGTLHRSPLSKITLVPREKLIAATSVR